MTQRQILARIKTVTRRVAWDHAIAGMLLQPIQKGQGLKAGEKVLRIGGPIRVVSVRPETLVRLTEDPDYGRAEAALEGFPEWTGQQFVDFICRQPGVWPERVLNRIEFEYL